MSTHTKVRIHMGCGEPLQSRWWIARTLSEQIWLPAASKKVSGRARSRTLRREAKYRS